MANSRLMLRRRISAKLLQWCVALLGGSLLGGCILLPIPKSRQPPFIIDKNLALARGIATRSDLLQHLGTPAASYCGGRELVYLAFQQRGVWFFAGLMPVPPIPIPVIDTAAYGKEHLLTLRFSPDDVLSSYELAVATSKSFWGADPKCTPDGTCIFGGAIVRYATIDLDAEAKRFEPVADKCVLYAYSANARDACKVDDTPVAPILAADGFVRIVLDPGVHVVWVTSAAAPLWMDAERAERFRAAWGSASLRVTCEPGSRLFVRSRLREGLARGPAALEWIDASRAFKEIAARRLILALDPLGAANCATVVAPQ